MTELLIPLLFLAAAVTAMARRQDGYAALLRGAQDGLRLLATLAPTLIILLALVTMLRESGFFGLLSAWLHPLFTRLGIPSELAPLMLIRPISGSAALALGADLMREHGVDSLIGRTAAVMLGSSETTFLRSASILARQASSARATPSRRRSVRMRSVFSVPRCSRGCFSLEVRPVFCYNALDYEQKR